MKAVVIKIIHVVTFSGKSDNVLTYTDSRFFQYTRGIAKAKCPSVVLSPSSVVTDMLRFFRNTLPLINFDRMYFGLYYPG